MRVNWVDTTLRDGAQMPGLVFSLLERRKILDGLMRAGIRSFEIGVPAMGEQERGELRDLLQVGSAGDLIAWNRAVAADVEMALACGFRHIHVSLPVSDLQLRDKLQRDRRWVLHRIDACVRQICAAGATAYVGAEDAARGEDEFFLTYARTAATAGAKRIRFADTVGTLLPEEVARRMAYLQPRCPIPIEFHGHNDFGLAVANAAAAVRNGIVWISGSLLGIGERAGNTDLRPFYAVQQSVWGVREAAALAEAEGVVATAVGRIAGDDAV